MVEQIISTGTCGVLADIEENAFLVLFALCEMRGTSHHYVAPSRYMEMQIEAVSAIEQVLEQRGIPYEEVMTWTTDGFTERRLKRLPIARKKAALLWKWSARLAAVAQLRGVVWGELLLLQIPLADLDNYDSRDWGSEAFDKALELCLAIVHHM